jgi:hypothetical protein
MRQDSTDQKEGEAPADRGQNGSVTIVTPRERSVSSASDPVLERDARDALVMAPVPGDDDRPVGYCDGADEEIGISEALSPLFEHGLGLAKDLRGWR